MHLTDVFTVIGTAMLPVLEIRAALPLALGLGFPPAAAFILSVIGNMLPIPLLILLTRHILHWMKRIKHFHKIAAKIEEKAHKHSKKVLQYSFWGLLILVAIPLPGTGAWTGALVASMLDMRLRSSLPAIFLGVCIAGILVMLVSFGVIAAF